MESGSPTNARMVRSRRCQRAMAASSSSARRANAAATDRRTSTCLPVPESVCRNGKSMRPSQIIARK